MYVVQSTVRTNLFLHGMSCDTLISHRGFLGKTAVSVWGKDYHFQHSTDWVIKDLHFVTLVFDHNSKSLLSDTPLSKGLGSNILLSSPCFVAFFNNITMTSQHFDCPPDISALVLVYGHCTEQRPTAA